MAHSSGVQAFRLACRTLALLAAAAAMQLPREWAPSHQAGAGAPLQWPDKSNACRGGQCNASMLPLMLKLTFPPKLPADCLAPPPAEDYEKPIVEVVREKHLEDGACHFNFFPWCTAAKRARDYFASVLPISGGHAVYGLTEYHLGDFRTAPGVSPLGAKLCYDNGFLDLPDELLWNYTLLDRAAARQCERLRAEVPDWASLTQGGMLRSSALEGNYSPPGAINPAHASKADMLRHEVWKCNMGHHILACDMAECIYNYCRLPDGRVGSGMQCRKDWLNPELVDKHWVVFEKRSA